MTKQNLKIYFLVSMMVFCAIVLRVLGKYDIWIVPGGIARSLIYIALYIGWGISVRNRIIQTQVRRYLISIAGLMAFWFVIRSTKYFFTADITIGRQLWYCYYLPTLFIPLFSVFVSISLGKSANSEMSQPTLLLYIPTVLCLLLVLTNDFHQLVFSFPKGKVWTDDNLGYEAGYYFVIGWEIICAFAAFIIMLIKCRLQAQTAHQIDLLDQLLSQYEAESAPEIRRRLLAKAAVIGAYIKRRGNLMFIGEKTEVTDTDELAACFDESFANLELMGVESAFDIPDKISIDIRDAIRVYDFFEAVTEAAMDDICFLWLKARSLEAAVIFYLQAECETELTALSGLADTCAHEEGVWRFSMRIGKVGEQA